MPRLYALTLAVLVFSILAFAPSASAANAVCIASPAAGPAGTTFALTARGFTPNAMLWTYAVDPSGTAFADQINQAFGGGVKADAQGTASFQFITRFIEGDTDVEVARALGTWTLVVQELGLSGATVHEVHCSVNVSSVQAPLSGAAVSVNPQQGFQDQIYTFTGSGYAPNEIVNLWLTPPANCDAFAFQLGGQVTFYSAANAFSLDSVKTDRSGVFSYQLFPNTFSFCTGEWALSAHALGSGRGDIARFVIVGHAVHPNGAFLSVNPTVVASRDGTFTYTGSGYAPNEMIVCWYTRPEGTVRELPAFKADSLGSFSRTYRTGFDGFSATGVTALPDMHYSEGALGLYALTCEGQASLRLAIAPFTLSGGLSDP